MTALTAFRAVGGYNRLVDEFFYASAENVSEKYASCQYPPDYSMKFFRPQDSDLPWTGVVFGAFVSSIWYWCTDQVIIYPGKHNRI